VRDLALGDSVPRLPLQVLADADVGDEARRRVRCKLSTVRFDPIRFDPIRSMLLVSRGSAALS
jgi:hypothetical protein